MDRQAVVVGALVLLAGCGGVSLGASGPETPEETLTPVPLSANGTDARAATPTERPPGVSAGGVVDARRLHEAHDAFLADRSYRWTLDYDLAGPGRSGPEFDRGFLRWAVVEPDRFLVRQANDDEPVNQSLFVNESGGYLQTVEGNVTRNQTVARPGSSEDYVPSGQIIERFLTGMDPNVTRVERRGRTYFRLHDSTGVPPTMERLAAEISNYSVTAYVAPEGFVRSMTVTFERSWETGYERVSIRFYYEAIGSVRVERPAWVADLPAVTPTPTPPSLPETEARGDQTEFGDDSTPESTDVTVATPTPTAAPPAPTATRATGTATPANRTGD